MADFFSFPHNYLPRISLMTKSAVITQSNYIPWRGWFEMLAQSDIWIIYDNVQFTKRDWRNRNLIRLNESPQWLTIPVVTKGKYTQLICETEVSEPEWFIGHKRKLQAAYRNFPHFADLSTLLDKIGEQIGDFILLTEINTLITSKILEYLGVSIQIIDARNFQVSGNSSERLVRLCEQVDADVYLTGPAAQQYLETDLFSDSGINIKWMEYSQLPSDFSGKVGSGEYSIVDLIARKGTPEIREYIPGCNVNRHL